MRPIAKRRLLLLLASSVGLLLVMGLLLRCRLEIVEGYQAPAGDGLGYYRLSQELLRGHRLAFGPPPAPLSYARLPGYPSFLGYVAVRKVPVSQEEHLRRATRWNVALDLLTAVLAALLLRVQGLRGRRLALLLVLTCPLMIFLSCYALTESLATALGVLLLLLALLAARRRSFWLAGSAGLVGGAALLVRPDMVTLFPAALLALWLGRWTGRRRALSLAFLLGAASLVYVPWPLRNLARFGAPHPAGAEWFTLEEGHLLPVGVLRWMATWCDGAREESYLPMRLTWGMPLPTDHPALLNPRMYDSESERRRLLGLYARYERERLSATVDLEFHALARERTARHPLRTYLLLPLGRLRALWRSLPEEELPMRSTLLHLPERRPWAARYDHALYALALLGALGLLRRGGEGRALALVILAATATRTLLIPYLVVIPMQRLLVELYPLLICLAAWALASLPGALSALGARVRPRIAG